MSAVLAVWRRELGAAFDSMTALVTTLLFVLTLHALFFLGGYAVGDLRLPGFWEGRSASLRTLFAWIPLLYVVLAPALSMGAWAEERKSGTEELLLTLPLKPRQAVLGKFLATWTLLCALLVVAVLPAAVVVGLLGPLDWSSVWGGLVGAAALGGACLALCLWVSSLSQDQLIAFLLSAVLMGLLWAAGPLADLLPSALASALHQASPATHFLESAALGVFDVRDLVYHGLFVFAGLSLNAIVVEGRRYGGGAGR